MTDQDFFGVLEIENIGGRPPQRERPRKKTISEGNCMLRDSDAAGLVDMMEKAGGDLDTFASSFDRRTGKREIVLARVLFILRQKGNEDQLKRWEQLIECFKQAKLALLEAEAMQVLEDMPKPNASKKKATMREWLEYGRFWKERGGRPAAVKPEGKVSAKLTKEAEERQAQLDAVKEMVAKMAEAKEELDDDDV